MIGHVEWVHLLAVEDLPARGSVEESLEWTELAAGSACAAAVQLLKLAGRCDFFTAVGDDDLAERALPDLAQRGVAVHAARRTGRTRRALVLADRAGEGTIVVHGARHHPRVADDLPWHLLESADCALFTARDDSTLEAARGAATLVVTARSLPARLNVPIDAVVGVPRMPGRSCPNTCRSRSERLSPRWAPAAVTTAPREEVGKRSTLLLCRLRSSTVTARAMPSRLDLPSASAKVETSKTPSRLLPIVVRRAWRDEVLTRHR